MKTQNTVQLPDLWSLFASLQHSAIFEVSDK